MPHDVITAGNGIESLLPRQRRHRCNSPMARELTESRTPEFCPEEPVERLPQCSGHLPLRASLSAFYEHLHHSLENPRFSAVFAHLPALAAFDAPFSSYCSRSGTVFSSVLPLSQIASRAWPSRRRGCSLRQVGCRRSAQEFVDRLHRGIVFVDGGRSECRLRPFVLRCRTPVRREGVEPGGVA